MNENKLCSLCHIMLPRINFHANKAQPDGLANVCKACRRPYQAEWRELRRKEIRASGIPMELLLEHTKLVDGILASQCWVWTGRLHENGYGIISYRGIDVKTHLGAWVGIHGPKPEGLDLDHLCRNRPCFRPDHLELTTRKVNLNRGLGNKGEVNGRSVLTEAEVIEIKISLSKNDGKGGSALAQKYGVGVSTISNIKNGVIWSWVKLPEKEKD